ncbi:ATP-binding protein [Micropruina sp.]|uniref:sensor histidine kinase n=1 Tax=Micropruina sp. TaxID=2737536 RepID=UPI0026348C6E|nr:ATP-binding protein [Micropruina sp.]
MSSEPIASLRAIAAHPGLRPLLVRQARRGVGLQAAVRLALAALMLVAVVVLPSATERDLSVTLGVGYLGWAIVLAGLTGFVARDIRVIGYAWLPLLVDLAAVTALTVVAGLEAVSWTATVLTYAFFAIPVLAATELRPWVCAGICLPTAALYFAAGAIAQVANGDEPWPSIVLRTAVLALVCAGAVASSHIQLTRVIGLARLAADRTALVDQLLIIEERERRVLSEQLHDGALQFVLAARMDLDDLGETIDGKARDRLDEALTTTARLLRSTVSELNPAVLAHAGLVPALLDLATEHGRRGRFTVEIDAEHWPDAPTTADPVLFATARELLANVVKHAAASTVTITVRFDGTEAFMTVCDDGRGMAPDDAERRLAQGHIGLHSRRTRVEAAGGSLRLSRPDRGGTRVEVVLPASSITGRAAVEH